MTQPEYEHKKAGCWEEASRRYGLSLMNGTIHAAFNFAFDRAYSLGKQETRQEIKQETDADTVIQGWLARDKECDIFLYEHEPKRIYDDEYSRWEEDVVCTQPLPRELFPDLTWDSDPEPVEIIIKRKKK